MRHLSRTFLNWLTSVDMELALEAKRSLKLSFYYEVTDDLSGSPITAASALFSLARVANRSFGNEWERVLLV